MLAVAGGLFARRALLLVRLVGMAKPSDRSGEVPARLRNEAVIALGQRKLLQRLVPGLMHAFIFWGFIVLLPTILMAMIAIADRGETIPWLGRQGWFALLVDVFCVLVLAGVATAFAIRKIQRPARFEGSHMGEADLILALIAGIVTTLLLWHASLVALHLNEWPAGWSPVSKALSNLFGGGSGTHDAERTLVWAHVLIVLSFLVYLPRSKHLHIATAVVNVYFGRTRARGRLEPLRFDEEGPEEDMRLGSGTVTDMTWKQVVDTYSCTECGRCQDACPAWATGKELSPKLLIMGLRDQLFAEGPGILAAQGAGTDAVAAALVPNAVTDDVVWDCVTCGACVHECPVSIEHIDHIVDLRRHLVMSEARFPAEAEPMLRDVERSSNPWGKAQSDRAAWAEGLGVRVLEPGDPAPDVLYWVGCAASFDERARTSAESTAKLLAAAGVDFAILGPREACTGDPARRMGNEYVFQAFAEQNVETLNEAGAEEDRHLVPALLQHARERVPGLRRQLRGRAPLRAAGRARPRGPHLAEHRRPPHHLPRLLLPGPAQRRAGRAARAGRGGRAAGRDGAQRPAHVLLRRRRRSHVDGGAGGRDQRGARPPGRRDGRRDPGGGLPLLHDHAGRRRAHLRPRPARGRRGHAACGVGRAAGVAGKPAG